MLLWQAMKLRVSLILLSAALLAVIAGCRSPWVQATIDNEQDTPVSVVEVTYPGGTFGVQSIAAHASFHYRFHILSNDAISIDFSDSAGRKRTDKGPALHQGESGTLRILIARDGQVIWMPDLTSQK